MLRKMCASGTESCLRQLGVDARLAFRRFQRAFPAPLAAKSERAFSTDHPNPARHRPRILSGVQPTGNLHLGNYLGALKEWKALQHQYDAFFCVVDLHAITVSHDPQHLRAATRAVAAMYVAAGVDPHESTVFVQSHVPAHAELTWLLSCATPLGWLRKMVQFKEKSKKTGPEEAGTGVLTYPVLMASDILLYQANVVPVGEDQRQHLELTRDIAIRMNKIYGGQRAKRLGCPHSRLFTLPQASIPAQGARCMSLQDGTTKMSKSADSDFSRINLLDNPDLIRKKIQRAKTDSFQGLSLGDPDRPESSNLLTIYQAVTGLSQEQVLAQTEGMQWGEFKPLLAEAIIEHLAPIQERYQEIVSHPNELDDILQQGSARANEVAKQTLDNVKMAMGFILPRLNDVRNE